MTEGTNARQRLQAALEKVRGSIKHVRDRKERIGEGATEAVPIAPVLVA